MKHLYQIQHLGDTFFDSFFPESNKTHTPLTVDFQRFHAMDIWRARRAFSQISTKKDVESPTLLVGRLRIYYTPVN